ncbi:tubby-like F-box protein 9 [Hordeum vulgare]|nr:tubby-like F-box protein 9 [Hordeum vulgare]
MDPAPPEVSPEDAPGRLQEEEEGDADEERWSRLLPELLTDIVRRTNASAERCPPCAAMSSRAPASAVVGATLPSPSSARRSSAAGSPSLPRSSRCAWILASPPVAGSGA